MAVLGIVRSLLGGDSESSPGTQTYDCPVCKETFESADPPTDTRCPGCLTTRVTVVDESDDP